MSSYAMDTWDTYGWSTATGALADNYVVQPYQLPHHVDASSALSDWSSGDTLHDQGSGLHRWMYGHGQDDVIAPPVHSGVGVHSDSLGGLGPTASSSCTYPTYDQQQQGTFVLLNGSKERFFTVDQVTCMCEALLQSGNVQRLADLLWQLPPEQLSQSEAVLRARALVAFHHANFKEFYNIIEGNTFDPRYHTELQQMWFKLHYRRAQQTKGRPLNAVDKYRLRRKYPPPRTIWDGEEMVYLYKRSSRNALVNWYMWNNYPNLAQKENLARITGLTVTQISNWFKNKRQRGRAPPTPYKPYL